MIHWHPGWLGSRFNVIVINIFVKAYGENECSSVYMNPEVAHSNQLYSILHSRGEINVVNRAERMEYLASLSLAACLA